MNAHPVGSKGNDRQDAPAESSPRREPSQRLAAATRTALLIRSMPDQGASPSVEIVTAAVVRFLNAEIMAEGRPIAPDDGLEAAGVDSMALLKVLVFLEREYGIWVPDEDLTDEVISSARTLATYVCRVRPAGSVSV